MKKALFGFVAALSLLGLYLLFGVGRDLYADHQNLHALVNRPQEDAATREQLEALFTRLGRGTWTSFVKNKLRLLRWPQPVLQAMRERGLGYTLAGIIVAARSAGYNPESMPMNVEKISANKGSQTGVYTATLGGGPPC